MGDKYDGFNVDNIEQAQFNENSALSMIDEIKAYPFDNPELQNFINEQILAHGLPKNSLFLIREMVTIEDFVEHYEAAFEYEKEYEENKEKVSEEKLSGEKGVLWKKYQAYCNNRKSIIEQHRLRWKGAIEEQNQRMKELKENVAGYKREYQKAKATPTLSFDEFKKLNTKV